MTEPNRVFVLGLGAQKAGTTWLRAYLDQFPVSDFGRLKEYHVWDSLHLDLCAEFDIRGWQPVLFADWAKRFFWRQSQSPLHLRRRFQSNTETYFAYFESLLAAPGISLTGDFTPAYSGLPSEVLGQIRSRFKARGIQVRLVFLMRDPIDRAHSAVRMYMRGDETRQGFRANLGADEALVSYVQSPDARMRADYHETLQRVYSVFPPEDVYVGFYESMFTHAEIVRLSEFFGLPAMTDFAERKFNPTQKGANLSPEVKTEVTKQLSEVYAYCFEHFPEVSELWSSAHGQTNPFYKNGPPRFKEKV